MAGIPIINLLNVVIINIIAIILLANLIRLNTEGI